MAVVLVCNLDTTTPFLCTYNQKCPSYFYPFVSHPDSDKFLPIKQSTKKNLRCLFFAMTLVEWQKFGNYTGALGEALLGPAWKSYNRGELCWQSEIYKIIVYIPFLNRPALKTINFPVIWTLNDRESTTWIERFRNTGCLKVIWMQTGHPVVILKKL